MGRSDESPQAVARRGSGVVAVAAAKLLLHLATASRYGYFGDELYFMACGEHLDWGYVDQPPLIGLVAWLVRHTLGTSLLAMRSLSALAGAALVVLTGLLARELGGGRFAMALAALASALAFVYVVIHYLFTMNASSPLLDGVRIPRRAHRQDRRPEALARGSGLLAGLGLQNKYSMAVFGRGLVVGRAAEPRAAGLRASPGSGSAARSPPSIFLPNVDLERRHGWPFLEFIHNVRASGRDVVLGPLEYVGHQVLNMNPASLPVWLAGLGWLLLSARGRAFRPLGLAFLVALAVFIAHKGQDYYVAPAFATLFAAGGVASRASGEGWRAAAAARPRRCSSVLTLPFLPLTLPILPADTSSPTRSGSGYAPAPRRPSPRRPPPPLRLAVRLGRDGGRGGGGLPRDAARGAGAGRDHRQQLRRVGRGRSPRAEVRPADEGARHAPELLALGPGDPAKDVFIVLGDRPERLGKWCGDVQVAAELSHPWTAVWENRPVLVCRQPRMPLARDLAGSRRHWGP